MSKVKITLISILAIVMVFSLAFGLEWVGIGWKGFFGPKHANVERKIFEKTQSYVHGKAQDLSRYRLQYAKAKTDGERSIIASTVQMQFAEINPDDLQNSELRSFLYKMMNKQ